MLNALLIGLAVTGLICYGLYQLLLYSLTQNELNYQKNAHKVTWTHEDMLAMGKKKRDHEMSDEEFHLKYGMFRHETYRALSIPRKIYNLMNDYLHYIELYLIHFGESNLKNKIKIDRPIFIIGDFRSGTSNLERLISHHPEIGYFDMGHTFVWKCPMLWECILMFLAYLRKKLTGSYGPGNPNSKGLFFPHSSNVLLTRGNPFECENIWEWCKSSLNKNRYFNWETLDSENNPDNNTDCDKLTQSFYDPNFETTLKNSIRMILAYKRKRRFINKNPLNGFRIGYLYKMFPDAKFVFIARNPIKTCKSQLLMQGSNCRAFFVEPQTIRKQSMKFNFAKNHLDNPKDSTGYLTFNQVPNDTFGNLWYPRVFPRTQPEHREITKYLKEDKEACAFAVAVKQQEKVVLEQIKECGLIEGKNLYTMWQEDLLDDAWLTFNNILNFLELESNDKMTLNWLEKEDFPNGQANKKRVESKSNKVSEIGFGDQTNEIKKILEPCLNRYNNRISIKNKSKTNNNNKNNQSKNKMNDNNNNNNNDDSEWATVSMSDIVDHTIIQNGK